jgi:hypothetical protein
MLNVFMMLFNYSDIKKVFGQPLGGDGYKIDAEWEIDPVP